MKKLIIKDLLCMDSDNKESAIINVGMSPSIYGANWAKETKEKHPNSKLMMDLKISDEDFLNAKVAFDEGADIVSVLAVADDEVIRNALLIAHSLGKKILVDFVGVRNVACRLEDMDIFGVDYVCLSNQQLTDINLDINNDMKLCTYEVRQYSYLLMQDTLETRI